MGGGLTDTDFKLEFVIKPVTVVKNLFLSLRVVIISMSWFSVRHGEAAPVFKLQVSGSEVPCYI